ncbi:uncharacterized protein FA14DRAFT_182783 [Meira miltonrushii]|uniref:Uncharacterized protein n=1 Tax=Meira miltonrushii TaxID=1280837 RepID=A0A316V1K5_9BASI|nr:uncharacterized protein FA14DRAFT_182783 [Meira miltonrushii]PWN31352.1 hypothetical protein FA14DRAFT_182783 [Meira miltonrushii]
MIPAIETNLLRKTLISDSSSTDVFPAGIKDTSVESSQLDFFKFSIKYNYDTEILVIEEEIIFLPQIASYRSSTKLIDTKAGLNDLTRRSAYSLQNINTQFTNPDDSFFTKCSCKLGQASSSCIIKASSTCIEKF